jgi:hypothetical protein
MLSSLVEQVGLSWLNQVELAEQIQQQHLDVGWLELAQQMVQQHLDVGWLELAQQLSILIE